MRYISWRIFTYRFLGDDSRHRVAAWRELRKIGAVALQTATWAVPVGEPFDAGLQRATAIVQRAGGRALCFEVSADAETSAVLESLYGAEREAEWAEFFAECDKAEAELASEVAKEKFTLAELDEEEQNIDRLRRWYRELRARDLFNAPSATPGAMRLAACVELLEDFAQRVYDARDRP